MALAAAHSLDLMHDNSAFEVYYAVLNGERKAGEGLVQSQTSLLHDPKKMAELGFEEGIGFVPFAGIGWGAIKVIRKDDASPVRAAAAKVLARDPDPATTKALIEATGDNSWIVQAAALEALAKRGDPSACGTVERYLTDEKAAIRFTAAAAVIHLSAIKQTPRRKRQNSRTQTTVTPLFGLVAAVVRFQLRQLKGTCTSLYLACSSYVRQTMKHVDLRWNPGTGEWFCTNCGRTTNIEDQDEARASLDQYECTVPSVESFQSHSGHRNQTAHQEAVQDDAKNGTQRQPVCRGPHRGWSPLHPTGVCFMTAIRA